MRVWADAQEGSIGGGTLEQTGGDVTIERNLNMGNGENPSSYSNEEVGELLLELEKIKMGT